MKKIPLLIVLLGGLLLSGCGNISENSDNLSLNSSVSNESESSTSVIFSEDVSSEEWAIDYPLITFNVTSPVCIPIGSSLKVYFSYGEWNPVYGGSKMTYISDNNYEYTHGFTKQDIGRKIVYRYVIVYDGYTDITEFDYIETDQDGHEISAREHTMVVGPQTIDDQIAGFRFHLTKSTLERGTLDIFTLTMDGYDDKRSKTIRVWLPEGYNPSDTSNKYPVLYMHDGQMLFDAYTSTLGEWNLDIKMSELIDTTTHEGTIIVGIDSRITKRDRNGELSPTWNRAPEGGMGNITPSGETYADFVVNTLKPYIDSHYNTLTDKANTGIAGGELGATMSLFMALTYQNIFGYSLMVSSAINYYDTGVVTAFVRNSIVSAAHMPKLYFFLTNGTGESSFTEHRHIFDTLNENDVSNHTYNYQTSGGRYTNVWGDAFNDAYKWALGI